MGLFVADSIKLGRASVALGIVQERSCSSTGYLSCRGKQSISLVTVLLLLSGGSLFVVFLFLRLVVSE